MAHIVLIATGGTIASQAAGHGGPVTAGIAGEALIAALHERPEGLRITVEDFRALGSYALDLDTVHALCRRISAVLAAEDVDGVVVTHGTDTMEETAWLADLLVASPKPVVFTGAQRHAGAPDSDGPRNIADALRVAASPQMRGYGATILFEGDIHPARSVAKTHTSRTDTFRSAGLGKIGEVDQGRVFLYRAPGPRGGHFAPDRLETRVELITPGLGSRPDYLRFCGTNGTKAVVIAGFGRGNLPQGYAAAIADLVAGGVVVVVASRCAEGRTAPVYGNDSGGTTLAEAGVIFAGSLAANKARLLLAVLPGLDRAGVAEAFARMG